VVSLLVAVAAVVTGIAARPVLENLIAGVIISFAQPIRIGDTVLIDGYFGTIENISLTHTTLKVWDWRRYMVPNHHMLGKEFVNYSIVDRYQWAYVEFWVAPQTDLDAVRDIATKAARSSRHFADYEEPRFWVMEMGKEGVRCWIAAWANTPSAAWQLGHDIRTELARRFAEAAIRTHSYQHHWDVGSMPPSPSAVKDPC
jgi:small-conductance mechanosensitive channel